MPKWTVFQNRWTARLEPEKQCTVEASLLHMAQTGFTLLSICVALHFKIHFIQYSCLQISSSAYLFRKFLSLKHMGQIKSSSLSLWNNCDFFQIWNVIIIKMFLNILFGSNDTLRHNYYLSNETSHDPFGL